MKSLSTEGPIDFTRLWILYYTPDSGRYNGAYIKDGFHGVLPVTLGTASGHKGFTIRTLNEAGKPVPIEYETSRDSGGRLIVKQITAEPTAKKPAGLYRATPTVRGKASKVGWIVQPDGSQVGLLTTDGTSAEAPALDPAAGTASVDGTPVTAEAITGLSGDGDF